MKAANLIPSRLIVLRRYPSRDFAEEDRELLIEAGIAAYVKREYLAGSGRALMVGEENAADAMAVLNESAPADREDGIQDEALVCPRCQSRDIAPLPPYAGLTFAAGAAAAVAALISGRAPAFAPLLGATILISTVVYVKSARWRCRPCGLIYGRPMSRSGTRYL